MAKTQFDFKPEINVADTTERIVVIKMDDEQVKSALFSWLRLQGVKLPSQDIKDYSILVKTYMDNNYKAKAEFVYKEKIPTRE